MAYSFEKKFQTSINEYDENDSSKKEFYYDFLMNILDDIEHRNAHIEKSEIDRILEQGIPLFDRLNGIKYTYKLGQKLLHQMNEYYGFYVTIPEQFADQIERNKFLGPTIAANDPEKFTTTGMVGSLFLPDNSPRKILEIDASVPKYLVAVDGLIKKNFQIDYTKQSQLKLNTDFKFVDIEQCRLIKKTA